MALPAAANVQESRPGPALGADLFVSTDSDDTQVVRAGLDLDWRYDGLEKRAGLRLEKARYDPIGSGERQRERIFVQAADVAGGWSWSARLGTDRHSVIGSATLHDNSRWRKEFFAERDVVETRQGLDRGIYATFVGAAIDIPAGERTTFTALAGVQEFTGDNVRFHLRGSAVHVLDPNLGLSTQLRGRYFRSSHPAEFDYYSPRWYAQVLPVLQMRRFVGGWELLGAGGIGVQRDAASDWRRSDFAQLRVTSPGSARDWSVRGELTYTNAPSDNARSGGGYRYLQTVLSVHRRF
jgi:hypothetical protein